ncbi:trypsin-like serine protease [Sulfitobacter mediterraneus]|uniref:trypsin-like serine peptidase n=1 Tax=Sulfitobacter mediterraneus TaxID=83219 RepID=UPI00193231D8|nr:trypsin-like serine protease [Sulfitobacter mediterraneus]MBM1310019.1 trypsin-like serine protease [Sulfitobacter mediterraneus]MBM1313903.1 trypsin-like serine protease [Sulfitobacter mediterraneus]MBM1322263.1 trypsin-like serine protease [Sulfitobacter mediterraneus]MBM1326175.1 trypsin-like serine protease [Sulfitobacter mediterraneus]MBM1397521.1 trypsin-like serine protease [Sulfitobacter mediterraneus]
MAFRYGFAILSFLLALAFAPVAQAEDADLPDAGLLDVDLFQPALDAVCGVGQRLGEGCDAIRARPILPSAEWPWRTVGRVNSTDRNIRSHCTGTLLSSTVVLTASHCLYNFQRKSWIPVQSLFFVAGYQRGKGQATARIARYVVDPVHDVTSRDFKADFSQDWALLVLADPIADAKGYLPLAPFNPAAPSAKVQLAGYPALRSHVLSLVELCGATTTDRAKRVYLNTCAAMRGDSGAPLLINRGEDYQIAGVFVGTFVTQSGVFSLSVRNSVFEKALKGALDAGGS